MEKRELGRTGERLSVIGFGGLLVRDESTETAGRLVAQAVERGVNYFDVAPQYGNAQQMLGPALEPYRQRSFLACKTLMRGRDDAWADLQQSLEYLCTDHIDLYQFHAVTTMQDVEEITAPGGALEAFVEARRQGLIHYIGFSAHGEEPALALLDRFDFDSVLFPVNWGAWHAGFGPRIMQKAQAQGVGRLALKAMCRRALREGEEPPGPKFWYVPAESEAEAELALRFTLSMPVTAAIPPGQAELFDWALNAAERLRPLSRMDEQMLARQSEGAPALFPLSA